MQTLTIPKTDHGEEFFKFRYFLIKFLLANSNFRKIYIHMAFFRCTFIPKHIVANLKKNPIYKDETDKKYDTITVYLFHKKSFLKNYYKHTKE